MAEQITDSAFEESVLKSDLPVLVDFWAPWCGPCRAVGPVVEEVGGLFAGRLRTFKMNVDENGAVPSKYGIRAIPTLMVFKGGALVAQHTGAMSKDALVAFVEAAL